MHPPRSQTAPGILQSIRAPAPCQPRRAPLLWPHMPDLEPDTTLLLPRVTVLKASAGSGKTYRLTQRYVQFLLSDRIGRNDLRNVMAITFANNASREMRDEVLKWLKLLCLGDSRRLGEMEEIVAGGPERIIRRAGELIEAILDRYSDFQVKTIDSFMSTVFRASALDFGFHPDFEILMEADPLLDYAFNLFLREAPESSPRADLLDRTVEAVLSFKGSDDSFPWDPAAFLLAEIKRIENRLSTLEGKPVLAELEPVLRESAVKVTQALEAVAALVEASGLPLHGNSTYAEVLQNARAGRYGSLVTASMRNPPVTKPRKGDEAAASRYEQIVAAWAEADARVSQYASLWARAYYQPFLRLHGELASTLEAVKRRRAQVFIDDIGRRLGEHLALDIVPDVYFRIGERVWHYLVDEFQDTSPLQWRALFPLVENSLSMGGSLLVVGDTKQAIYGFRQADYGIMRSLEAQSPFASAPRVVRELTTNWRSRPRVLELSAKVFRETAASTSGYQEAARRSGLDSWTQTPREEGGPGYAEVEVLARDDDDPPEREKLLGIMEDLQERGWGWGDIALLARRNEDIVRATSWLNEKEIPFISFSSLDVRTRAVAGEMLALLAFLDSPPDDLSFATFILGEVFARAAGEQMGWTDSAPLREFLFHARGTRPLYKELQRAFPRLWKTFFAGLFRSAGYLPLYDLVSEAYAQFAAFRHAGKEEATLAKLLEVVKDFEGSGTNSLRAFLGQAGEEAGKWAIDVPRNAQSVRAMTIHKAKGLGFPVVVLLLYGESSHGFPYAVLKEDGHLSLVRVTEKLAKRDKTLEDLLQEETVKARVDALNMLYVALTRAKREMFVIGVRRDRDAFPFDLLPADSFAPSGERQRVEASAAEPLLAEELSHEARPVPVSFAAGRLGREERRRGELAHRMLELTEYAGPDLEAGLEAAGARAARQMRTDPAEARALVGPLARMIRGTALAELFRPAEGRTVLTERELCDAEGRLFRMDRIVVDPRRVTVVDFKTGAEDPAAHEAQLRGYAGILSDVYPGRSVGAVAAYLDLGSLRVIA